MNEKEFNLLDEKWIRVIRPDARTEEVSLTDALLHAHEYADLAGELPTQDVAVLRLLLAVLHTVFSRMDCEGREAPLTMANDALVRWRALWQMHRFPKEPIRTYLATWHERFWLFHPERPFYQVNEAAVGTESKAYKLNGEISQSNNKERLFSMRSGELKERLTYAEAARWLLHVNGFDDTSAKAKGKGLPRMSAGWLGKLGIIIAAGGNLFETLLLNMVLLLDGKLWKEPEKPCWELEAPRCGERIQISTPCNASELLTLQSRRILLQRETNDVKGYVLLGGDFFPKEDALQEQMTVWTDVKDRKGNHQYYQPRRHNVMRQMWRDFGAITTAKGGQCQPGVVKWVTYLQQARLISNIKKINFRIASVQYGDSDYFVKQVFADHLTFHTELLTDAGITGYKKVLEEIDHVEKAAEYVGWLSENLNKAAGCRSKVQLDSMQAQMQARFFDIVDTPFRQWLASLDPTIGSDGLQQQQLAWRKQAKRLALQLGNEMVQQAGTAAFIGRVIKEETKGKREAVSRVYSAPKAINLFKWQLNKLYPTNCEKGNDR